MLDTLTTVGELITSINDDLNSPLTIFCYDSDDEEDYSTCLRYGWKVGIISGGPFDTASEALKGYLQWSTIHFYPSPVYAELKALQGEMVSLKLDLQEQKQNELEAYDDLFGKFEKMRNCNLGATDKVDKTLTELHRRIHYQALSQQRMKKTLDEVLTGYREVLYKTKLDIVELRNQLTPPNPPNLFDLLGTTPEIPSSTKLDNALGDLVDNILNYESDTFSASAAQLTKDEAEEVAVRLIQSIEIDLDGVRLFHIASTIGNDI
jgi:hypothetical protein